MKYLDTLYQWYGKKAVRIVAGVVLILVIIGFYGGRNADQQAEPISQVPVVTVSSVASLSNASSLQLIGTVRARNEAEIETQKAGRVTAVYATLGQTVGAGALIGELENAQEYGALLQAQGVYEAAQVAAQSSSLSEGEASAAVNQAENSAITTYASAFNTLSEVFYVDLTDIFADPEYTYRTRSVVLANYNQTIGVVDREYDHFGALLADAAKAETNVSSVDTDLSALLGELERMSKLLVHLRTIIGTNDQADDVYSATEQTYLSQLSVSNAKISGAISSIRGAESGLTASRDAYERATLAVPTTELSSANAQLKQALGSLRIAQANYEKTLLRTPIAGQVQELRLDKGAFLPAYTQVARVANEGGLEITTYVSEQERTRISVGQPVMIDGTLEGSITQIAPSVDSQTKKVAVKIATESTEITNGDTVRILIATEESNDELLVPLAAIKLTATDAAVFMVQDGVLTSTPVTLGDIRGAYAQITQGLTLSDEIVSDVRGLSTGQSVDIQ